MDKFAGMTSEFLREQFDKQVATLTEVSAMPDEQRQKVGPKGEVSPEQGAFLNGIFLFHAARVLNYRGLLTPDEQGMVMRLFG